MPSINWRNLQLTLLRGGVAPKYARRTIQELQQHHADLVREFLAKGVSHDEAVARANHDVGDAQTIAQEVLAKRELLTWSYRFPKLVFLAVPIVGYPILFLTLFFSTILLPIKLFESQGDSTQHLADWVITLLYCLLFFYSYLLAPLFLVGVSMLSRRRTTKLLWPLIAVVVVAFIGSGLSFHLIRSLTPGESSLGLTWGYSFLGIPTADNATTLSLLRMTATVAVCGACMYFYRPLEALKIAI